MVSLGRTLDATKGTVSAVLGGLDGLFARTGPVFTARLEIDRDADVPGGTWLLRRGRTADALVRFGPVGDEVVPRTMCIKVPDAYGPGRDQDLLLASSADGAPLHHAVLPAASVSQRLYSSLWLYLAGFQLAALGARAHPPLPGSGAPCDRVDVLVSGPVSRFRAVGLLTLHDELPDAQVDFRADRHGGGLRPLPPAAFYRG